MNSLKPSVVPGCGTPALDRFLAEVLGPIGRRERRRWAAEYIRGLLSATEKKTISSIAAHLPSGNAQAMHHVLAHSPWDWNDVMRRVAETVMADLEPEPAWALCEVGFTKRGADSVGVARQPCGPAGHVDNVQVGVSLHHVGVRGNLTLGWRLFLPREWALDYQRRHKAEIPDDTLFRTRPELALDLIDQALAWRIPRAVVVAAVSPDECAPLAEGLRSRGLSYVLEVPESIAGGLASHESWSSVRWWGSGPGEWLESQFSAVRVPPPPELGTGAGEVWLLAERPGEDTPPTHYFLADLPPDWPVRRLARLAKAGARASAHVRELHVRLGLDHFEGRNWRGWHHHVTLVAVAQAFRMTEMLCSQPDWFSEETPPD
ncbi:MAG TPA: IS701 family transposase [Bryobacteraceae bacterium]|nr:IS701 family transposase [Bryobacteraceae bacterium]